MISYDDRKVIKLNCLSVIYPTVKRLRDKCDKLEKEKAEILARRVASLDAPRAQVRTCRNVFCLSLFKFQWRYIRGFIKYRVHLALTEKFNCIHMIKITRLPVIGQTNKRINVSLSAKMCT